MYNLFVCRVPVNSGSVSSVLVWMKVNQWCGNKIWLVLKVLGEDIYRSSNHTDKVFSLIGYKILVGVGINLEFLSEFRQLKEHRFGFVGHKISEVWNGLNDFVDGIFERLGWLS